MSGYVKLFGSLLDSTVWETPAPVRVVWIAMLAMADRDGEVEASVPGLARRAGVTREDCEAALALFLAPDPDSRTKDHEGRRIREVDGGWLLLNYEKYRDKATKEEAQSKAAARQERWRKRHPRNANVTPVTLVDRGNALSSTGISEASPQAEREDPALEAPQPDGMTWQRASRLWAEATGTDMTTFPLSYHSEHFRSIVRSAKKSEKELRRVLAHYVADDWVQHEKPPPKHLAANWNRYHAPRPERLDRDEAERLKKQRKKEQIAKAVKEALGDA